MTPYSIIVTILLVAAAVLMFKLIIKTINLHDELTSSEQERDAYMEEYTLLKDKYADLLMVLHSAGQKYHLANTGIGFAVVRVFSLDGKDINTTIKKFSYNPGDKEDINRARLEAEDLLDALNGKVGWRVTEDIGQSARTPDSQRGAKQ